VQKKGRVASNVLAEEERRVGGSLGLLVEDGLLVVVLYDCKLCLIEKMLVA